MKKLDIKTLGEFLENEAETIEDVVAFVHEQAEQEGDDNDDDPTFPIVIELDEPVQLGKRGMPVQTITMREPTLGDMRGVPVNVEKMSFDHLINVAASMSNQPPALIRKLPAGQASKMTGVAFHFLFRCLST